MTAPVGFTRRLGRRRHSEKGSATIEAVNKPAVQAKLREIGSAPRPLGPTEFQAFINEESAKWREVVRVSGARLD